MVSYGSIIGHLLLYLAHISTHSCLLSHMLIHLYVLHTHTSSPPNGQATQGNHAWHIPQLNRCSFASIPLAPKDNIICQALRPIPLTLKPRAERIWLPLELQVTIIFVVTDGRVSKRLLNSGPHQYGQTDSTDESL